MVDVRLTYEERLRRAPTYCPKCEGKGWLLRYGMSEDCLSCVTTGVDPIPWAEVMSK